MKFTNGPTNRSHYKKDMFILLFCQALFIISKKQNELDGDGIIAFEENYPEGFKNMLDEQIDLILEDIDKIRRLVDLKTAKGVKSKINAQLPHLLQWIARFNISLEVLSASILYYNFTQREVLHKNFEPMTDETRYELIIETVRSGGMKDYTISRLKSTAIVIIEKIN
jgi:hypothetical protein